MNIGCDIEQVSRFKGKSREQDEKFLNRLFTQNELDYCFSKTKPEESLCARFCAKEAYIKAKGAQDTPFNEIEIIAKDSKKPALYVRGVKIEGDVSISHTEEYAMAVVLC
ncbi:holo-ACP synthase [bacterium]|nr:holo-ACP synthase [bacterium]